MQHHKNAIHLHQYLAAISDLGDLSPQHEGAVSDTFIPKVHIPILKNNLQSELLIGRLYAVFTGITEHCGAVSVQCRFIELVIRRLLDKTQMHVNRVSESDVLLTNETR